MSSVRGHVLGGKQKSRATQTRRGDSQPLVIPWPKTAACSRDGSVRLWECGSQQQLRVGESAAAHNIVLHRRMLDMIPNWTFAFPVWPHQAAGTSTSLMGPALHALAIASCSSADGAGLPPPGMATDHVFRLKVKPLFIFSKRLSHFSISGKRVWHGWKACGGRRRAQNTCWH